MAAVPSELPDLVFYDAIVPVKMELELVLARLQQKWVKETEFTVATITRAPHWSETCFSSSRTASGTTSREASSCARPNSSGRRVSLASRAVSTESTFPKSRFRPLASVCGAGVAAAAASRAEDGDRTVQTAAVPVGSACQVLAALLPSSLGAIRLNGRDG